MKNEIYSELREYVKKHHGWSGEELKKTELYQKYLALMEALKTFNRKKVKLTFTQENDWIKRQGQKIGKVVVNDEGRICFFEGRCTRRGYYLDAGLYEGWQSTLIPLEIEEL